MKIMIWLNHKIDTEVRCLIIKASAALRNDYASISKMAKEPIKGEDDDVETALRVSNRIFMFIILQILKQNTQSYFIKVF